MPAHPPLTIAIPTYNRREKVAALCAATLAQMGPGDELVVSDNASTDGTAEALAGLPGVSVISHPPPGLGMVGNWNYCLTAGTNDWVCLVHSDDRLCPNGLSTIREVCSAAGGRPALVGHAEWNRERAFTDDSLWFTAREPGPSAVLAADLCASGVTMHRGVCEAVGKFDPSFAYSADVEYFPRVCARFRSYVIQNPRVVEYVFHGENYQLDTWQRPDFLSQLMAVERAGIAHAGLPADEARRLLDHRINRHLRHMLVHLRAAGQTRQVRHLAATLHGRPGIGRRLALSAQLGKWFGWYPKGLLR